MEKKKKRKDTKDRIIYHSLNGEVIQGTMKQLGKDKKPILIIGAEVKAEDAIK